MSQPSSSSNIPFINHKAAAANGGFFVSTGNPMGIAGSNATCYHAAMEQRALVFTGGKGPLPGFDLSLIPECSYVCAADSGVDTALNMGFAVDEAIGDFDSISALGLLDTIAHTRLPQEKDVTDTEALLQHVASKNIPSYILVGGGEGRFDHLLHLYTLFATYGPPDLWITGCETLHLVRQIRSFDHLHNFTVSVLPALFNGKSTVNSKNLRWELHDFSISLDHQSISNRCIADTMDIQVTGDPVFVSIPFAR